MYSDTLFSEVKTKYSAISLREISCLLTSDGILYTAAAWSRSSENKMYKN